LKKKTSWPASADLDLSAGEGTTRVLAALSTKNLVSRFIVIHSWTREKNFNKSGSIKNDTKQSKDATI